MTIAELVSEATRRVVERTGADALEVRDAVAHAVQLYVCAQEAANDVRCNSLHKCNRCDDCAIDDEDDDSPTEAELREHDREEYAAMVRSSMRVW